MLLAQMGQVSWVWSEVGADRHAGKDEAHRATRRGVQKVLANGVCDGCVLCWRLDEGAW